jgi:hypothetical protein
MWSWRKQKFVNMEQCFQKLTAADGMLIFDFMEGVLRPMVDEVVTSVERKDRERRKERV